MGFITLVWITVLLNPTTPTKSGLSGNFRYGSPPEVRMAIRIVYLDGTHTARFDDITYTAKGNAHSPIPPLVRRLIAEQRVAPNDLVEVRHQANVSFKPRPAVRWAAVDIVDDRTKGLHTVAAYLGPHVPNKGLFHGGRVAVQGQPALPG